MTTATATGLPDGGGTILSAFPRRHRPPLEQASRVIQSENELAQFASAALAKLKEMPEKLRSFFGDPALRYIAT